MVCVCVADVLDHFFYPVVMRRGVINARVERVARAGSSLLLHGTFSLLFEGASKVFLEGSGRRVGMVI